MSSHGQISRLIATARTGGPEVLGELLQKYSNYLRLLAITHLDARLRSRVSPSDIVQETNCDAHRDFPKFRGQSEGEFVAWLRAILVHNLARLIERHVLTEKRDIRREVSLHHLGKSMERSTMRLQQFLATPPDPPGTAAIASRQVGANYPVPHGSAIARTPGCGRRRRREMHRIPG